MLTELLLGIAAGLITSGLLTQFIRFRRMGGLQKIRVFEPKEGQFNTAFYAYFVEQLGRATEEIVITGEGFTYRGSEGQRLADLYHSATRDALARGVHVIRFQTFNNIHPRWRERLRELLIQYPGHFHLYLVNHVEGMRDLASVCVIDAARRDNVMEMSLSTDRDLEDCSVRLADTAIFIHGRKDLAAALRSNVMSMKRFGNVVLVTSADQLAASIEEV
ncbi:hypothetical protein ACFXK0_21760 [Nocardia sp. NPDC059177]|uniref:hypothetical protein n=1 Tax=Nocardia sp. NPDC059177 TaxID=3346759 RepID=UPI0036A3ACFC